MKLLSLLICSVLLAQDKPKAQAPATASAEFLDFAVAQRNYLFAKSQLDQAQQALSESLKPAQGVCEKQSMIFDPTAVKCVAQTGKVDPAAKGK